jgi:hypothetical protein
MIRPLRLRNTSGQSVGRHTGCTRAASGHAAAVLPGNVMNSRRVGAGEPDMTPVGSLRAPTAWWNGRHSRLKICFWETGVPVRVPRRGQQSYDNFQKFRRRS